MACLNSVIGTSAGGSLDVGRLRTEFEPELQDLLSIVSDPPTAGGPAPAEPQGGGGVLSTPQAWSVAVYGAGRTLRHADARFTGWLADPSARTACLKLLDLARHGETRFGLIEMPDDGVIAICAAPAAAALAWTPGLTTQLSDPDAEAALVAFAPSRSVDLVRSAADAFGLTPLEARLVEALLQAPTLQVAADRLGVGRETAKEALANAMRKVGVERTTQLLSRIIDLISGAIEPATTAAELPPLSELTPAEARIAMALARGETAEAASRGLGLSIHTVKSHRKTIFSKLGINRARDLNRVMVELQELRRLTARAEVRPEAAQPGDGRLRVIAADAGRRVAMIDYGPASGRPIMVSHGLATGLRIAPALVEGLQRQGYRPLAPQRPGFGLTDIATGDYLATAADDMAAILDRLGAPRATVLAREGATAAAMAFGERHSDRLERAVLLNPRLPLDRPPADHPTIGDHISRFLMHNPRLIGTFFEALRRQSRSDLLHIMFQRVYAHAPADQACAARPEVRDHLVRDVQGLVARTSAGVTAEHLAYADGWRIPAGVIDARWHMAYSDQLWSEADLAAWRATGIAMDPLEGAGLLAQFTHAEALIALI